jgi:hypothetical protein
MIIRQNNLSQWCKNHSLESTPAWYTDGYWLVELLRQDGAYLSIGDAEFKPGKNISLFDVVIATLCQHGMDINPSATLYLTRISEKDGSLGCVALSMPELELQLRASFKRLGLSWEGDTNQVLQSLYQWRVKPNIVVIDD